MRPTALVLLAAAVALPLSGCGTVRDTFGVKSVSSPTASSKAAYLGDLTSACATGKKQFDTDAARFKAATGKQAQAEAIDRIVQDYADLSRELSRVLPPTEATRGLAVQVLDSRLPDRGALTQKAADLRANTTSLTTIDVTTIATGLKSDFCQTYTDAVSSRLG